MMRLKPAEVDAGDEPKSAELSPPDNEASTSQPIPIRNLKKILEQKETDD